MPGHHSWYATALRRRALCQLCTSADRTRHAGAAEATIAGRIFRQILLVIVLGEIELRSVDDLAGDRAVAFLLQLLLIHRLRCLGCLPLRSVEGVDAGAVLVTNLLALP